MLVYQRVDVFFGTREVGVYGCWILLAHQNEGCSHVVEDPFKYRLRIVWFGVAPFIRKYEWIYLE
jgi:hypothetical protein